MEWVTNKKTGNIYAPVMVGGRVVFTAMITRDGVPCIILDTPAADQGIDMVWPANNGVTNYADIEMAKKAIGEALAGWGRDLIDMAIPPVVVWVGQEESGRLDGQITFGCCDDRTVEMMVHYVGDGVWAAKVRWSTLRHEGGEPMHFNTARKAQDAAEQAAREIMLRGRHTH